MSQEPMQLGHLMEWRLFLLLAATWAVVVALLIGLVVVTAIEIGDIRADISSSSTVRARSLTQLETVESTVQGDIEHVDANLSGLISSTRTSSDRSLGILCLLISDAEAGEHAQHQTPAVKKMESEYTTLSGFCPKP